jgi:hypothetical protein
MRRFQLALAIASSCLVVGACASGEAGSSGSDASAKAAKPPVGVTPPENIPMAKVQLGMNEGEVRKIMGDPNSSPTYTTGKAWIPFYFGPDAVRTDWKYKGVGRVVFGQNRWSGSTKVIRIDYDPSEDGA